MPTTAIGSDANRSDRSTYEPHSAEAGHLMDHSMLSDRLAGQTPTNNDIWQAAALLAGLLGTDALNYANARCCAVGELDDPGAAETWQRIAHQVERLLRAAPQAFPPDDDLQTL